MRTEEQDQRERGHRAEQVGNWYFRLNGFFLIPDFVVHPDVVARWPRTDADLIGVRMPFSRETLGGKHMRDDERLLEIIDKQSKKRWCFILVEVKAGDCAMNGPWSQPQEQNVQRVIARMGFVSADKTRNEIADAIYQSARFENESYVVQYICIGKAKNSDLQMRYPGLLQIDYKEIGTFLYNRFRSHPEKIPMMPIEEAHRNWPDFGKSYAEWFRNHRHHGLEGANIVRSQEAVFRYINTGNCE